MLLTVLATAGMAVMESNGQIPATPTLGAFGAGLVIAGILGLRISHSRYRRNKG